MSDSDVNCGNGGGSDTFFGLRIASVFIIWAGSTFGAMFPVLARRTSLVNVPKWLFECVLSHPHLSVGQRADFLISLSQLCKIFRFRCHRAFFLRFMFDAEHERELRCIMITDRNGLYSSSKPCSRRTRRRRALSVTRMARVCKWFFVASAARASISSIDSFVKPYALALALLSIFSIFIVELAAFRIGTAKLAKLGIAHGTSTYITARPAEKSSPPNSGQSTDAVFLFLSHRP